MNTFPGIQTEALFLLAENRFQDSKVFYEEHKPAIQAQVIRPLRHLVEQLTPAMLKIDPLMGGGVSRVRRDNRYTHDKRMYRENMWITFMRDKRSWDWCVPAFYLDFSLDGADWGLGFYSATPTIMKTLRAHLEADPARAIAAVEAAEAAGFQLMGQPYARPRSTEETPLLLRPFYNCKSIVATRREPVTMVSDDRLPQRLEEGFAALAQLYRLLTEAMEEVVGVHPIQKRSEWDAE